MPEQEQNPQKLKVAEREEAVLAFWKRKQIFEKSLEKPAPKGEFVFYDGPPFATGLPHYGHILAGTIKDVIPRFKTMQGYHVRRRWGWDCHGLPVENLVEKELGLKTKRDIETLGIEKFNRVAREAVLRYAEEWREIIPRTGRWVDMDDDYKTMDARYTESVWFAFKELHKKGLIYEGFKSMHLCPRCGTTLSNFEVSQGYKDVTDISVYVKFELTREPGTCFLVWTTTPWTLPGNVALAVHPDIVYVKVAVGQSRYILAKEKLSLIKEEYTIVEEYKGSELVDLSYKPVFNYYKDARIKGIEKAWKVYVAPFVTLEKGTGVVHIAPAFGEDDLALAELEGLPLIRHVSTDGKFVPEIKDFAGIDVKPKDDPSRADIEILKNIANRGLLFAKEKITHSYPHCWRCETPLLNFASSSWFVKTTALKEKLIAENNKIRWVPREVGENRFGDWLSGIRDWAISRSRYFGAPIPVWKCEQCEKMKFVGSIEDLKDSAKPRNNYLLMRHGEAENNVLGVVSSYPNNPHHLTEKGKEQVKAAVKTLLGKKIDLIISSPFLRTKETAEIVADHIGFPKEKIIYDERLREIKADLFNGRPIGEYHLNCRSGEEQFKRTCPGGEHYVDIAKRVGEFIYNIDKRYEGKNILMVTHDSPAWLLESVAGGHDLDRAVTARGTTDFFIKNAEVKEIPFVPLPHNEHYALDLHRPYIDSVVFVCSCGGIMRRVPEVFDCWFESGSMPYAGVHYPFENKDTFDPRGGFFKKPKGYPADFIAEGLDQTRGWFYSTLVLSVGLFDRAAYEHVVVNGTVLAEDGQKMSKHLKNYPDPMEVVERYGADAMRYYLLASPASRAQDFCFSEKEVGEILKKVIQRLDNVLAFFLLYAEKKQSSNTNKQSPNANVLDRWILARLSQLGREVTVNLEAYELDRAARPVADFIDDLSTWYLRRSRERFKGGFRNLDSRPTEQYQSFGRAGFKNGEKTGDREQALQTLHFVLLELSKIMAPLTPFFAEEMYQKLRGGSDPESVHLESWPKVESRIRNQDSGIIENMAEVRRIVSIALELRAKAGIKVRQPLKKLKVKSKKLKVSDKQILDLIADEINVKEVIFAEDQEEEVELDFELTAELKEEGKVREFIRGVQELRKNSGLTISDFATLTIQTSPAGRDFLEKNKSEIIKNTLLKGVRFAETFGETVEIDDMSFILDIKK
ncbi:MAG: hypothetical protein A2836_02880 [Candidatus Taylorbacteria bacterium RIFCSPHIGHO2_01_FULL_45_63]|uniref:Isoleucine--tRNA ligase n=1 Tax=Candidatus Taylorbacteria bacterium RIFCSPHIGHO2_02_FULL_45_35 TaxID=1802311 RepID=A0A1G2MS54_9BACT|nr:MAG: hypothetical protein A2836_02880 [Candidatus Taylorbacteria bacterium RIFCSPHIGHO2_01_FULL_45_63]OHA25832.1 MAG: hypothetical protein A3D56_01075 [Candidatus Taylorbacteria bacterium RIFCSPHIGHO2_02_FULL_45_35]OHA34335.1 MAG: hypothetical protein A3A22_00430 [Candidatus Taylorbacteria bacterium RIFCSPLOWO2_01_FULL_45_34b]